MTPPETLLPPLRPLWPHWNLGRKMRRVRRHGHARLLPLHVTARQAELEYLSAGLQSKRGGRWTPEGRYVLLEMSEGAFDGEEHWSVVMSDTPDEMNDHHDVLLNASGRVLVHGLGLGCVTNCLIHMPHVAEIDVVEIDEDVIALTWPRLVEAAFAQRKTLNLHVGSCVDIKWPVGSHWNYVWHDIWSAIEPDNLSDDKLAEHNISYATLHRKFGGRCDRQGSWALREAHWAREVYRLAAKLADQWVAEWKRSTEEERLSMIARTVCGPVPAAEYLEFVMRTDLGEQWRTLARRPFKRTDAKLLLMDTARNTIYGRKAKADQAIARRYGAT